MDIKAFMTSTAIFAIHPLDSRRRQGMFVYVPAHKTRYVAPRRDNRNATFHRQQWHIAFAGEKMIGNDRATTYRPVRPAPR
jgi:hypothetical protein